MKYILPAKKNTNYISTLMPFLVIIGQLMFIFGAQAQTRPYDNTEINVVNKGGLQSDSYFGKNNTSSLDVFNLSTMLRYGFTNNMSIIDLLFCTGPELILYLKPVSGIN